MNLTLIKVKLKSWLILSYTKNHDPIHTLTTNIKPSTAQIQNFVKVTMKYTPIPYVL